MGNHRGQMGNHRNQMGNHRDQMGNNREQMGNHRDQMSSHRGQMGSHRGQFGGNQGSSGSNRAHGPMAITNDCRYPLNSRNYQDTEWNHNRNNKNNDQKEKKPKELYIPPEENEEELFNGGISSGINFVNYDNIPVKVRFWKFEEVEIEGRHKKIILYFIDIILGKWRKYSIKN